MKKIEATVIADSINPQGNRITTFLLTYPRFIHSELMTHRMFSRNAASSRAVPVKKMIESVRNNMFTPLAVQKAHKGMQGSDYFEGVELEQAKQLWIESAELALQQAEKMEKFGITKQLINRILEPYQYYQVLVTATEFDNFFELRCPVYDFGGPMYKSKKESIADKIKLEGETTKILYDDLFWLNHNKSQAEIHIQKIAEMMWDSYNESTPKQLKAGQWHVPFGDKIELAPIDNSKWVSMAKSKEDFKVKVATARCARISYMTFDGEIDYEKDIELHDQLLESKHYSPFEHCARAMSDGEYDDFHKGDLNIDNASQYGWCNNFRGFIPYRYLIENNKK